MSSSPVTVGQPATLPATKSSDAARLIWFITGLAFLLRCSWVLISHSYHLTHPQHFDFGEEMGAIARSIATGHGFTSPFPEWSGPTTWVAPVYPFLIAAVFKLFGLFSTASAVVLLGFNCAVSALTIWPLWKIAEYVTTRRVAFVCAWCWALLPPFMAWAVFWIWDAALTTLVLTWIIWFTIRLSQAVTWRNSSGFGFLWGFAALLNPSLLSLFPVTLAFIVWHARRRREPWLAPSAFCALVFVLTIAPWLVRNYIAFGKFVFIRGNFWAEMHFGNSIWADGTWQGFSHPEVNMRERRKYVAIGEQAYFAEKEREVKQFIHQYPHFFAELCFRRVLLYWWDFGDFYGYVPDSLMTVGRRTFSTLALVGVVLFLVRKRPGAGLITGALMMFPLPYYLTYPYGRYRHVIEPLLLICAVYAVSRVKELRRWFPETSP
jgi:hypothetical protein